MKKNYIARAVIYFLGLVILAAGITMNTKTGLGVSTIISVPFAVSTIWNVNFSFVTFVVYALFVVIEIAIKGKNSTLFDWLQLPFSVVFSLLLNLFSKLLSFSFSHIWQNALYLAAAIICTAVGMSLMIAMKLVPNPADGLAQAIGGAFGKDMGFGKNILDVSCVVIACIIGLVFSRSIIGIGIGTLAAMLLVGRCVAVFDRLFRTKMKRAAGLAE
ncbi:DUF6198 family protein [Ruminococcus sp.]|uniref:YczE/YyaS/YitT family protein n=1 Tax=Ruminococcus sp. TaxID=41978 RepID=UPI0025DEC270|nr:DUF6198 family protein [Ruminococcus sp.]